MMAQASVVIDETFNYEAGNLADVEGWTTTGTLTTGDGRLIQSTPLEYVNDGGEYILSGEGKKIKHNYSAGSNYITCKSFSSVSSGAVYLTYIYLPDGKQSQSNGELLGLTSGTSSPSARPWVGKIDDTTKGDPYRFGLTFRTGTGSQIVWGSKQVAIGSPVLLVLKYDIANAKAALFINPEIGTTEEPAADIEDDNDESPRTSINAMMFRNQGSSKANYYISGVRVSTTWAEAVAKKESAEPEVIETIDNIIADFSDADIWGAAAATTADALKDTTINGFEFSRAGIQTGSVNYEATGARFTNRISIDKASNGGMVTFPAVVSCAQVDIYASSGSDVRQLKLQQYNYSTKAWSDVQTFDFAAKSVCYRLSVTLNSTEPTKLRLANADGSTKYIWKIVTYQVAPTTLDVPVGAEATAVTDSCFTANWAAVNGAAGYRVIVYDAEDAVVKRANVEADATSLVVNGLAAATAYTYKVAAIGDDADYVDSNLSEAVSVTTAASTATAINQATLTDKAQKVIINGQLYIRHNGELMSLTGVTVQ